MTPPFEKRIDFAPAWDQRNPDPEKNFGIHGVEIFFMLIGPKGGVSFSIMTNWMLPHVQKQIDAVPPQPQVPYALHRPIPADVCWHHKTPQYEDHRVHEGCELTGGPCYIDCGTLIGQQAFEALVTKGDDGLWAWLESAYRDVFEKDGK